VFISVRRGWALETSFFGSFNLARPFLSPTVATQTQKDEKENGPVKKETHGKSLMTVFVGAVLSAKWTKNILYNLVSCFLLVFLLHHAKPNFFLFPSLVSFSFFLFAIFFSLFSNKQINAVVTTFFLCTHTVCFFVKKGYFFVFLCESQIFFLVV